LIKKAIEWSKGELDEDYDPEKELVRLQERANRRLEEDKEDEELRNFFPDDESSFEI